jgi:hypothetical protein
MRIRLSFRRMADTTTTETGDDRRRGRAELFAAILLGIAGVLTAFCAYKAALTDGDALQGYTESTQQLTDSNQFYSQALSRSTRDQQLFSQFALESQTANEDLVAYMLTLMDDNLRDAVLWWSDAVQQDDTLVSPFVDHPDNPYVNVDQVQAVELEAQSNDTYEEAVDFDEEGDQYELAAVLFALTLFFAGIATLLKRLQATYVLLAVGTASSVAGFVVLVAAL